jgi:hypothetical protein
MRGTALITVTLIFTGDVALTEPANQDPESIAAFCLVSPWLGMLPWPLWLRSAA